MSAAVRGRYSRPSPCPICGGCPTDPPGRGIRCYGFISGNGEWAYCTRDERAGGVELNVGANAYPHILNGPCACGVIHGNLARRNRPYLLPAPPKAPRRAQPALDADTLDRVFRRYLQLCPRRPQHHAYFASRGAADAKVASEHGYGSLPLGSRAARDVVRTLVAEFGIETMRRVPGFYEGKDGRLKTHTARADDDAAIVVGRDELGRISTLVRRTTAGQKAKYRNYFGGSNDAYAVAGPEWCPSARRVLVIIEGIHKAHDVAALTEPGAGVRTFGIIGAHLNAAHLEAIRRIGPDVVVEALDADKFTNASVGRQRAHMHEQLLALGCEVRTAIWGAEQGKGLDDVLASGDTPRLRTLPRRLAVIARKPLPIAAPGPVEPGRHLDEVQAATEREIRTFVQGRRGKHGRVKIIATPRGSGSRGRRRRPSST